MAPTGPVQTVTAVAGFAYGVVGADLHVFGDGTPLYLLEQYRPPAALDRVWLRQMPSRMLNARTQVVAFTGRDRERHDLTEWLTCESRMAVRWLHAPGGQGKTRLAGELARTAGAQGWKVVTAIHGVGAVQPSPGSQDLRLDGHVGVLLIVDYADRWTTTALTWLLRNALLWQLLPTRVLLLGRTAAGLPALSANLQDPQVQADTSVRRLPPIPDSGEARWQMFTAARDSFAALYGLPDPSVVPPPTSLDHPDFGLTLALHIAALASVDAHATSSPPPSDPHQMTGYLLNREYLHWEQLYEQRGKGLDYRTPPSVMARTVFTAALSGHMPHPDAEALLREVEHELPVERIITDHAVCYPAANPTPPTVLEPLYPDRLAEDYLALTLTGTAEHPAHAWATTRLDHILDPSSTGQRSQSIAARAVTYLTAATTRWPDLGHAHLYPRLREHPHLALAAGGPTIVTLASIPHVDPVVLEAVERLLPRDRHVDLDAAAAAITGALIPDRLATTDDPAEHARLHAIYALRLANAGRREEALPPSEKATGIFRRLAEANPAAHLPDLARSLNDLGIRLTEAGRREDALTPADEAVTIRRQLAEANPAAHLPDLAKSLNNLGSILWGLGRREDALALAEEAVTICRSLAETNPAAHLANLAMSLNSVGIRLSGLGRWEDALAPAEEAVTIHRQLAQADPAAYLPDLAGSLSNLGIRLSEAGRREDALAPAEEAVTIDRQLAQANPAAHLPGLAMSLNNLGAFLSEVGRREDALASAEEAVTICRRLAEAIPAAHLANLAMSLNNLGLRLSALGREGALAPAEEATKIYRRLAQANPAAHLPDLATSLGAYAMACVRIGRNLPKALVAVREAIDIFKPLARQFPEVFAKWLFTAYHTLADVLDGLGGTEEAAALRQQLDELVGKQHTGPEGSESA